MRSKSIKTLFDELIWFLIYSFPILVALFICFKTGSDIISVLQDYSFQFLVNNPITSVIESVFGSSGVIPFFESNSIFMGYLVYFVSCVFIHTLIDILLWIPRAIHNFLGGTNEK